MTDTTPLLVTETFEELKQRFQALMLRGSGWRFEVGEVLYKIKEKCEQGEWGAFLEEHDLPRSTADGYIQEYKQKAGITETREIKGPEPTPEPDDEAERRRKQIEEEKKKRRGKKREHSKTE